MLFDFAALGCKDLNAQPTGASDTPFYPHDLLSALQGLLAALADLEAHFEIARDGLEDWSGPGEEKQRCRAELEQAHRQAREPLLQHLGQLQERAKAVRSTH